MLMGEVLLMSRLVSRSYFESLIFSCCTFLFIFVAFAALPVMLM